MKTYTNLMPNFSFFIYICQNFIDNFLDKYHD